MWKCLVLLTVSAACLTRLHGLKSDSARSHTVQMISGFLSNLTGGNQETVESVLKVLTGQSGWSEGASLAGYLKARETWFARNKAALAQHLPDLDLQRHSLGCLYILSAQTPVAGDNEEAFVQQASIFIRSCSAEQVRLAPEKFIGLVQYVQGLLVRSQRSKIAISLLRDAIIKVAPGPEYITPLHADCFQMCLTSKCYSAAAPLLAVQPENVDPSKTGMTARHYLLYCYYGAMIQIGRKRYAEALRLLLHALTAPTFVVNAITMAAHKKYILVSLIHAGSLSPLPKFTPASVSRSSKMENSIYLDLANAYKDDATWARVSEQHHTAYFQDGNWGLVQLAGESRAMRRVQRLTQTYITLSLQDIATTAHLASPQQAELFILRMIDAGQIFAQIDEGAGMVRFLEDPEQYSNAETAAYLDDQVQRARVLAEKLRSLNHEVSCEKSYLNKIASGKERAHPRAVAEDPGDFANLANADMANAMMP